VFDLLNLEDPSLFESENHQETKAPESEDLIVQASFRREVHRNMLAPITPYSSPSAEKPKSFAEFLHAAKKLIGSKRPFSIPKNEGSNTLSRHKTKVVTEKRAKDLQESEWANPLAKFPLAKVLSCLQNSPDANKYSEMTEYIEKNLAQRTALIKSLKMQAKMSSQPNTASADAPDSIESVETVIGNIIDYLKKTPPMRPSQVKSTESLIKNIENFLNGYQVTAEGSILERRSLTRSDSLATA
jgi:hypothetical protein